MAKPSIIVLLMLLLLHLVSMSAALPAEIKAKSAGNILLTGLPKSGTSYLHYNLLDMFHHQFGFPFAPNRGDIHRTKVSGTLGRLTFDHIIQWDETRKILPTHAVAHAYRSKQASCDKMIVLVRDAMQSVHSGYHHFGWNSKPIGVRLFFNCAQKVNFRP